MRTSIAKDGVREGKASTTGVNPGEVILLLETAGIAAR